MKQLGIKNPHFELISSTLKGFKEVQVIFNYKGKNYKYFIFIEEDGNVNYISAAKKQFEQDIENGKVAKTIKSSTSHHPWLIAGVAVLGAVAITFTSLYVWKMFNGTNSDPIGPIDETVSTLTYEYSPYSDESINRNKVALFFELDEDDEIDAPFGSDAYVQWNKDDPSTKVKLNAGDKLLSFDYKQKYPDIGPTTFTIVVGGDVRTFGVGNRHTEVDEFGGDNYITSINIGQSVKTISHSAFTKMQRLYTVHIAGQVNKIWSNAFAENPNLINVDFSSTNETDRLDITSPCFAKSNNLKSIHFPKRLTYLGPLAQCRALEEITIPEDNEYFTATYKNDENKIVDSGVLATKKFVKSPFNKGEATTYDIDYEEGTVIASTTHPHFYEGIRIINSLSGTDIEELIIPKYIESINAYELIPSQFNRIYVEQGNQHYTDLYQDGSNTANVLAELNEDKELSIIKVAKEATPIGETGVIYSPSNDPINYQVTDFAYGAAFNSSITSLDLPSTIETFNFDHVIDSARPVFDKCLVNPFHTTIKDLTIRSETPPTYKPDLSTSPTTNINDIFGGERTDSVNIHVPEASIGIYAGQVSEDDPNAPGWWNFSDFQYSPETLRFKYSSVDSETFSTREEAKQWVAENYTSTDEASYFAYTKWDFTPLIDLQSLSPTSMDEHFAKQLKDIHDNYESSLGGVLFIGDFGASICPYAGKYDPNYGVKITPLNSNNFDSIFAVCTNTETTLTEFSFSVHDGCLEAVQCPSITEFKLANREEYISGRVKREMKFDKSGYFLSSRLDIEDFSFVGKDGNIFNLGTIYYSLENFGSVVSQDSAKTWASEHSGEADIDSRSLNWSFVNGESATYEYSKVVTPNNQTGIRNFIKSSVSNGTIEGIDNDDLHCKKAVPCIHAEPKKVGSITQEDIDKINGALYYIDDASECLYIYEPADLGASGIENPVIRVRKFNKNGICENDAFYFQKNGIQSSGEMPFSGYLEITNHFAQ